MSFSNDSHNNLEENSPKLYIYDMRVLATDLPETGIVKIVKWLWFG